MTRAADAEIAGALETLLTHDARFVRLVAEETEARLGADGLTTVEQALTKYGAWLARSIHGRTSPGVPPRLHALLQSWDSGEVGGGRLTGWSAVDGGPAGVTLVLTDSPALRHFEEHGVAHLGAWFYDHVFAGVSKEVGVGAPTISSGVGSVSVRWNLPVSEIPAPTPLPGDHALLLHTTEGRGALMALVGQALLATHDATGELCLRTALARFGDERGRLLRQRVDDQGLPPTIINMIRNYDSGGHTSVWEWADGGELTADRQFEDCTFCPFVPVWRDLDAMEIGRIYDYEFHIAQFRAFNPDIRLRWESLQTRGDPVCAFRFTLPGAAG